MEGVYILRHHVGDEKVRLMLGEGGGDRSGRAPARRSASCTKRAAANSIHPANVEFKRKKVPSVEKVLAMSNVSYHACTPLRAW